MALDPDEEEIEEAVAENNVGWLKSVLDGYRDPSAAGKAYEPGEWESISRVMAFAR